MMDLLVEYQWNVFIALEIASLLFIISFLIVRYTFNHRTLARTLFTLFIAFILLEAILAIIVYKQTGKIETFQIVIFIFVFYACTFGISDFKKLDRYMKQKIGKWRGVDLLTEEDKRIMKRLKDPKVIARKNFIWWLGHTTVFVGAFIIAWTLYGNPHYDFMHFLRDWSWFDSTDVHTFPFTSDMLTQVMKLWLIIYVIDAIIALSYVFFPGDKKAENK